MFNRVLVFFLLLMALAFSFEANAGRSKEFGHNKNVYVTEWSKLKHQAELGNPDAMFALGNFHFQPPKGSSFRRNYKKAGELYFQASLRKNPSAQYNVALMLHQGLGFKVDLIESYVWFFIASTNDSPVAKHINRKTAQIANQMKSDFNNNQISDAQKRIDSYLRIIKTKRYREARLPEQT